MAMNWKVLVVAATVAVNTVALVTPSKANWFMEFLFWGEQRELEVTDSDESNQPFRRDDPSGAGAADATTSSSNQGNDSNETDNDSDEDPEPQ